MAAGTFAYRHTDLTPRGRVKHSHYAVNPSQPKTSLMASLYFCSEIKGRIVVLPKDSYLFRIFFAIVTRGTDMVFGLSSFVLPLYNQKHPLPHSTRSYDISHLYDNLHNIEIRIYLFERLMQDDLKSQNPQSGAVPLPLYRQEFHPRLRVRQNLKNGHFNA